ncbi:M48 family metallopeptidase [Inquilinus sp. CAU 1745]|uniref:M48 family metallopeptidase n=1 Tax=Inquilinus sp. CAU 1745 TaxID=3140369 RepID=UPI00325BBB66
MGPFPARYNDGLVARTRPILVEIAPDGLTLRSEEGFQEHWPAAAIRAVDLPARPGPVVLSREGQPGCRLVFDDPVAHDALRRHLPDLWRRTEKDHRAVWRVAGWGMAAAAAILLIVLVMIPRFAVQAAAAMPESWERQLGARVAGRLVWLLAQGESSAAGPAECADPAMREAMDGIVRRLAEDKAHAYTIHIANADLVNAFALPGGHILMPKGMIEFAGSPEALAGILAHEIGHAALNHPTEAAIRTGATGILLGLVVGDFAGGAAMLAVGQRMLDASYSREAELAADAFAIDLMKGADVPLEPSAALFDRLAEKEGDTMEALSFLSTHPDTRSRADALRRAATEESGISILTDTEWRALRDRC